MQGRFELSAHSVGPSGKQYVLFDSRTGAIWTSPELGPTTKWQRVPSPEDEIPAPILDTSAGELERAERDMILKVLKETGGNKLEAAKRLGIGRQTLYNKLTDYGIPEKELGG